MKALSNCIFSVFVLLIPVSFSVFAQDQEESRRRPVPVELPPPQDGQGRLSICNYKTDIGFEEPFAEEFLVSGVGVEFYAVDLTDALKDDGSGVSVFEATLADDIKEHEQKLVGLCDEKREALERETNHVGQRWAVLWNFEDVELDTRGLSAVLQMQSEAGWQRLISAIGSTPAAVRAKLWKEWRKNPNSGRETRLGPLFRIQYQFISTACLPYTATIDME